MKRVLVHDSVLFSLLGSVLFFSSCLIGNKEEVAPTLAKTAWEYLERETTQDVDYELETIISFSEERYSIVEIYRENREILSIRSASGPYEFDGEQVVCRVESSNNRNSIEYEMEVSRDGEQLVWDFDGYTMVFLRRNR